MTREKPKSVRLQQISDLYFDYYWAPEMDKWVDELIMDYEDRLLKMKHKISELLDDIGTAQGFKVRPLESTAKMEET